MLTLTCNSLFGQNSMQKFYIGSSVFVSSVICMFLLRSFITRNFNMFHYLLMILLFINLFVFSMYRDNSNTMFTDSNFSSMTEMQKIAVLFNTVMVIMLVLIMVNAHILVDMFSVSTFSTIFQYVNMKHFLIAFLVANLSNLSFFCQLQ